jgi:hypothetical protein
MKRIGSKVLFSLAAVILVMGVLTVGATQTAQVDTPDDQFWCSWSGCWGFHPEYGATSGQCFPIYMHGMVYCACAAGDNYFLDGGHDMCYR